MGIFGLFIIVSVLDILLVIALWIFIYLWLARGNAIQLLEVKSETLTEGINSLDKKIIRMGQELVEKGKEIKDLHIEVDAANEQCSLERDNSTCLESKIARIRVILDEREEDDD